MSTEVRHIKKSGRAGDFSAPPLGECAKLAEQDGKRDAEDETRALWLVILQALAMVTAAIRRYIGKKDSCETCGRVL